MNRMNVKRATAGLALVAVCLVPGFAKGSQDSGRGDTGAQGAYTIEVAGSTSVAPLMELLAKDYAAARIGERKVTVNINGTGSSDGINAAAAGTTEVGMTSRELSPSEKGSGLTELVIAIDGIAVIVNPANPLGGISIAQCRDIYAGRIRDWSELTGDKQGPIAVVSREPGSGTRGAFEEIVGLKDALVPGSIEFDGTGAVKAEVSRNVDAIGYISLGSADASVKALEIEGTAASTANVINGTYRIARPFILLTRKGTLNPETQRFLDWIMSAPGQGIVKRSWISVTG
ncbi:MAG: phosphate ABC transporter substrate-binding protein [Treponema sp.]|jgi:phosphate transport system substrate-binding protein|nr:phosphate ABC transporter substrate-binding protein [Treponema sp.]